MPASIAGLPERARRIGILRGIVALRRLASRRPCHAQAALAGEQGERPLGSPSGKSPVGRLLRKNVNEKIYFRGFARRNFPLWLRLAPLFPPRGLRRDTRGTRATQCFAPEFSRMLGNSHSRTRALSPVFARNGLTRFLERIALWQNGEGQRPRASGWFSSHPRPCRPTIRQNPIRAFASSSACWHDKPHANLSKPNGSAHPVITSQTREIAP